MAEQAQRGRREMNDEVFDALKEIFSGHSATGIYPFDKEVYQHIISYKANGGEKKNGENAILQNM